LNRQSQLLVKSIMLLQHYW